MTSHVFWVCGWLGIMGIVSPYARAEVVERVVSEIKQDRIERTEQQIFNTRVAQCHAPEGSPARQQYTERLNELWDKYRMLTDGQTPRLPECNEV